MRKFILLIALWALCLFNVKAEYSGVYIGDLVYNLDYPNATVRSGNYTFTEIDIPQTVVYNNQTYTVTKIYNGAFLSCKNLERVKMPDTINSIGDNAFEYCTALKQVNIPKSLTTWGSEVFRHCTSLTTIVLPDEMETIGWGAFWGCSNLESINFPKNLKTINGNAFDSCRKLFANGTLELPEGLESINEWAFAGCNFEEIKFPNSLTYIGEKAFTACNYVEKLILPDYVKELGPGAFDNCRAMKEVKLPKYLEVIGESAFTGMESLHEIEFPENLKYIGDSAFYLDNLFLPGMLPESLTYVGADAFNGNERMQYIYIGKNLKTIGARGFYNCNLLHFVVCESDEVIAGSDDIFSQRAYDITPLYVPEHLLNQYKTTSPWKNFKTIETYVPLQSLKFEEGTKTQIEMGYAVPIHPVFVPSNANGVYLSCESHDINIVEPNWGPGNYNIIGRGLGTTSITVSTVTGVDADLEVEVVKPSLKFLYMSPENLIIRPDDVAILTTVSSTPVSWSIGNPEILSLYSENEFDSGISTIVLLGLKEGTCDVTATDEEGDSVTATVIVTNELGGVDVTFNEKKNLPVYDLMGRVVRKDNSSLESLQPGLYIIGGQKVIITK